MPFLVKAMETWEPVSEFSQQARGAVKEFEKSGKNSFAYGDPAVPEAWSKLDGWQRLVDKARGGMLRPFERPVELVLLEGMFADSNMTELSNFLESCRDAEENWIKMLATNHRLERIDANNCRIFCSDCFGNRGYQVSAGIRRVEDLHQYQRLREHFSQSHSDQPSQSKRPRSSNVKATLAAVALDMAQRMQFIREVIPLVMASKHGNIAIAIDAVLLKKKVKDVSDYSKRIRNIGKLALMLMLSPVTRSIQQFVKVSFGGSADLKVELRIEKAETVIGALQNFVNEFHVRSNTVLPPLPSDIAGGSELLNWFNRTEVQRWMGKEFHQLANNEDEDDDEEDVSNSAHQQSPNVGVAAHDRAVIGQERRSFHFHHYLSHFMEALLTHSTAALPPQTKTRVDVAIQTFLRSMVSEAAKHAAVNARSAQHIRASNINNNLSKIIRHMFVLVNSLSVS